MRDAPSSKPSSVKLTNVHIVISSLAAIIGAGLATYQTFAPHAAPPPPVNVVVSVDPQKADAIVSDETIAKTDAPALKTETIDLAQDATVTAALKDGSENRYSFASLFDGADDTFLAITPPDQDLDMLVSFAGNQVHSVTAIEYLPPQGVDPASMATALDVTVLPGGGATAAGMQVYSFSLPQSRESRVFAIPGAVQGAGVILRVAGKPEAAKTYVGDFRILSEQIAP